MSTLSFSTDELTRAGAWLTAFLCDYERTLAARPVLPALDREALASLLHEPLPQEGIGLERLCARITDVVVPNSTAVAHPRFLAYVLGPPNGVAPFAEAIAAALNQNCNFWQLSPAANVIERRIVSWLGDLFGYGSKAGGLLTSGGSAATLTALSAAMHDRRSAFRRRGLQGSERPLVVYTSEDAHGCVDKAAVMLGLGLDHVVRVAVDGERRMRVDRLSAAIAADRAAGREPFCVVATCGTVATGAIDPIDELAGLCAAERLWLHVDGAFGALFVLSAARRDLRACGRADSIALDPHKLLFAPLEAGCLIVRDRDVLTRAFRFDEAYLGADDDPLLTNFKDSGPQLSRAFKAFKIWCALQVFGVRAFSEAADRMLALAGRFADRLRATETFELLAPVTLNAVCFALKDAHSAAERREAAAERHLAVLRKLAAEGTALIGPVQVGGRAGLRACITNHRTTADDIDLVVDRLTALGQAIVATGEPCLMPCQPSGD